MVMMMKYDQVSEVGNAILEDCKALWEAFSDGILTQVGGATS